MSDNTYSVKRFEPDEKGWRKTADAPWATGLTWEEAWEEVRIANRIYPACFVTNDVTGKVQSLDLPLAGYSHDAEIRTLRTVVERLKVALEAAVKALNEETDIYKGSTGVGFLRDARRQMGKEGNDGTP